MGTAPVASSKSRHQPTNASTGLFGHNARTVDQAQFLPLSEQLLGNGDAAAQLALRVAIVGGWHQFPIDLAERNRGRTKSVKRLAKIAKLAETLAKELDDLNPLFHRSMTSRFPDSAVTGRACSIELRQLVKAARGAAAGLRAQGSGRPEDVFTRRTVRQLTRITEEATGRRVTASKGKAGIDPLRLTGPGGEFITRCFALIDPSLTDSALVRCMRLGHRHLRDPTILQEDKNSLELVEFLILNGRITPF